MVGPISPVSGPGSSEPLIDPFTTTGLPQDTQEALEGTVQRLRDGRILPPPRITFNDLFAATVETLLDLIAALKDADFQENAGVFIAGLSYADAAIANQGISNQIVQEEIQQLEDLEEDGQAVETEKTNVLAARDDYNDAVDLYNTNPTPANLTALQTAASNLNSSIDAYNLAIAAYNTQLSAMEADRSSGGFDSFEATNGLTPLPLIPEGEKITFPSTDLIPNIVTAPPLIDFDANDPLYTNLDTEDIGNSYSTAFTVYSLALADLNNHIQAMNTLAEQPGFDPAVDYPPLAATYNDLVTAYNTALAALESERDDLNALGLPGLALNWDEEPEAAIPTSVATYTPLPAIVDSIDSFSFSDPFAATSTAYNDAVAAYETAKDALNSVIDSINSDFQDPGYTFAADYAGLAAQYNAALSDYNDAVADLETAIDDWNSLTTGSSLGTIGAPLAFDIQQEEPLPLTVTTEPPPRSDIAIGVVFNGDLYVNFTTAADDNLDDTTGDLVTTQTIINDLVNSNIEPTQLSLIFLKRGQPSSEIYEPVTDALESSPQSDSSVGGSLGSLLLGIAGSEAQRALSSLDVAQTYTDLFIQGEVQAPRGLSRAIQGVFGRSLENIALGTARFAIQNASNLLEIASPGSFPINLAVFVALAEALTAVGSGDGFTEITRALLGGLEGVKELPNDNREELFETIGSLTTLAITFAALSDLGGIAGTPPEFALGTLALNLSFGSAGSQLDVREALKSLPETLQGTSLDNFQEDLTGAFTDVLASGGIPGDASGALAIRFAEKLFAADDPGAFIRETLSGFDNAEELGGQIANLAILATFSPQLEGLAGVFNLDEGDPRLEVVRNRLQNQGFDEGTADAFTNAGEGSFLQQAARLQSAIGPEAVRIGFSAIRDFEVGRGLSQELAGEIDAPRAQQLVKDALTGINSLENQQDRIISDLIQRDNLKAIDLAQEFAGQVTEKAEKLDVFLESVVNPANSALLYNSVYYEGMIPRKRNMDVSPGDNFESIDISA